LLTAPSALPEQIETPPSPPEIDVEERIEELLKKNKR
jgi:hypothetical protein